MLFSCFVCKQMFPVSQAKFREKLGAGQNAKPCCRACAREGDEAKRKMDALDRDITPLERFLFRKSLRQKSKPQPASSYILKPLIEAFGDSFERLSGGEQVALVKKEKTLSRKKSSS